MARNRVRRFKGRKKLDESSNNENQEPKAKEPERKKMSTGFPTLDGYTSDAEPEPPQQSKVNAKKKKSGGFQSMGLSRDVYSGIIRKGYKIPTPIQRKSMPIILEGKDMVAMARTGSGKTAAFLIPMLERLQKGPRESGCRALILSPTRELAMQTLKFTKELGRCCSLKAELILGGDSLAEQFAALHTFPDIVIATPGRLLHVMIEMDMKMSSVEYLVFDEADRLFEMGFAVQLQEIIRRVPANRQTLLFSATLPKSLVEFAQAGLHNPALIRLDVDNKISQDLRTTYFYTRTNEKTAILLYLLRNVVKPGELTVVFLATKHHVEYMSDILKSFDISCAFIFSALDPSARKINIAKFSSKKTHILLVTDVAARGIDIPMLDNVINYNFPAKPKLFVHRVGRVARAGRTGAAYSLVGPDEVSYLLDLHLFLGRPLQVSTKQLEKDEDGIFGRVPQLVLAVDDEELRNQHDHSPDLVSMQKVCSNAMKLYTKSRPLPSTSSIKRSKEMNVETLNYHPMFKSSSLEARPISFLDDIKKYKPNTTIFEINATTKKLSNTVMQKKREKDNSYIKKMRKLAAERDEAADRLPALEVTEEDVKHAEEVFSKVSLPRQNAGSRGFSIEKQMPMSSSRDEEFYIPHVPSDRQTELGLGVNTFEQQASEDILDLTQDENATMYKGQKKSKWDRKRKRFVGMGGKDSVKKIKTESGNYISASYKKNIYQDWLKKTKGEGVNFTQLASEFKNKADAAENQRKGVRSSGLRSQFRHKKNSKKDGETSREEVLSNEQILKGRKEREKKQMRNKPKKFRSKRVRRDKWGALVGVPMAFPGVNKWKGGRGGGSGGHGSRGGKSKGGTGRK